MDAAKTRWNSSNSLVNSTSYDTDARLTAISVPGVQSLGFSYDVANRVTEIGNGMHPGLTQNFGYDAMSRLTSVYSSVDENKGTEVIHTADGRDDGHLDLQQHRGQHCKRAVSALTTWLRVATAC